VFIGELRRLKGVDILIKSVAILARQGRRTTATIVGDGPDRAAFEGDVKAHGLGDLVQFVGPKPARLAFTLGRLVVVPSRAESLPYVVLEAAAAGVPIIASCVGGIPEIFGPDAGALVPPGDAAALASAINLALQEPTSTQTASLRLQARVRAAFSADDMTEAVIASYRDALDLRNR
jgi:glycosyltransferase involved in cell wall biosynthesis